MSRKIISLAVASMMAVGSLAIADTEIEVKESKAFIAGYESEGKYTFKADDSVKRSEIAKIIAVALGLKEESETFEDVADDHWAAKYIGALQKLGYVKGDTEGNYNPESGLTRAEMAQIIYNILEEDDVKEDDSEEEKSEEENSNDDSNEADDKDETPADDSEDSNDDSDDADDKDETPADDEDDSNDDSDNSDEADDEDEVEESKFNDIEGHWGKKAIDAIADKGIVAGYPGEDEDGKVEFRPDNKVTRAEAVKMILKLMERNINEEDVLENLENKFEDLKDEHWAKALIIAASNDYKYEIKDDKEVIVKEDDEEDNSDDENNEDNADDSDDAGNADDSNSSDDETTEE